MISTRHTISSGDPGIDQTLRHMRRLVNASTADADVIEWAQGVVRYIPERDPDAAAQAFLNWVRANMRYTEDPTNRESIKTPEAMIKEFKQFGRVAGDCDDQVTLLSAGLNSIGVETEFLVVAADGNYPNDFSHVLMQYLSKSGEWVTVDPIVRGTGPGWFPPRVSRIGYYRNGRLSGMRAGRASSGIGILLLVACGAMLLKAR